jgi:hypothetical protein
VTAARPLPQSKSSADFADGHRSALIRDVCVHLRNLRIILALPFDAESIPSAYYVRMPEIKNKVPRSVKLVIVGALLGGISQPLLSVWLFGRLPTVVGMIGVACAVSALILFAIGLRSEWRKRAATK